MNDPSQQILDLRKRVEKAIQIINDLDGKKIDLSKQSTFIRGAYLHQDTDEVTEEESAAFERENPELFNFLRSIDDEIGDLF